MGFMEKYFGADMTKTKSDEIYDDAYVLFNSEEQQNETLPADIRDMVLCGADCDVIPNAEGEFGHCAANPIPCNGPMGELAYLSKLRVKTTGSKVFFHKIDRIDGRIDVFELVNAAGTFVDMLYVDMYHPRKSKRCPDRYIMEGEAVCPRGILEECPDFPKNLYKRIKQETSRLFKVSVADAEAKAIRVSKAQGSLREYRNRR